MEMKSKMQSLISDSSFLSSLRDCGRCELQVGSGADDAGGPRSPGLPLRHLSAAGR